MFNVCYACELIDYHTRIICWVYAYNLLGIYAYLLGIYAYLLGIYAYLLGMYAYILGIYARI